MTTHCNCCNRDYKQIIAHYKTQKHRKNAENYEAEEKIETYDCEICFMDYPLNEFITLSCNHKYCKNCLQYTFKIKIEEKKVRKIICPCDKCEEEITFNKMKEILEKEMFEKYDSALLDDTFINDEECIFCPVLDCGNPIYGVKEHPKIICRKCDKKICYNCKTVGWHEGKCEMKQDEGVKEWMKETGAKPCPNCSVPIEKNKGCDHIYCINCKHHFYWSKPEKKYTGTKYIPHTETEWNEITERWNERYNANPERYNLHWGADMERQGRLDDIQQQMEQILQVRGNIQQQMEQILQGRENILQGRENILQGREIRQVAHRQRQEARIQRQEARIQRQVEERQRFERRYTINGGTLQPGGHRINCNHCNRIYPERGWETHCKTQKHRRNRNN